MTRTFDSLQVRPLSDEIRKKSQLGAEIILPESMALFNPCALSEVDKQVLRDALFEHGVIIIRNQQKLPPQHLVEVARIVDPDPMNFHSGGKQQVTDPRNILSQNNCSRIPRAPQVTVIGQGCIEGHEGIPKLDLKHLDQSSFHENPLEKDEIESGLTRPYRWHMDAPLYDALPGFATTILALEVPQVPDQKLQFADHQSLDIAAVFSGARNFELLSPEEQEFALNTTVHYAPRAYEWIKNCKASADGLTIESLGREMDLEKLPEFSWEKVHSFPVCTLLMPFANAVKMVWRNRGTSRPHLQIAGCCVYALTTKNPKTGLITSTSSVEEARRICHNLQKKVYAPENVFAHRWSVGDLVIFHNRGVMHSISGQLSHLPHKRLMWQCSMASNILPEAFREIA